MSVLPGFSTPLAMPCLWLALIFISLFPKPYLPNFSQVVYTTCEHAQHKTLSSVSLKKKKPKKRRPQAHLPPTSSSCKVKVKVTSTLCDPIDYTVQGIL